MILIPRGEGVATKPIKTAYSSAAGTAFVTFDEVRVPVEYTLGEVDKGLKVILSNFNHERWMMVCQNVQLQRNIVDETLRYVQNILQRVPRSCAKVSFMCEDGRTSALCSENRLSNKLLFVASKKPSPRSVLDSRRFISRIAQMISRVESCQTWLEHISEPSHFLNHRGSSMPFPPLAYQMSNMVGGFLTLPQQILLSADIAMIIPELHPAISILSGVC